MATRKKAARRYAGEHGMSATPAAGLGPTAPAIEVPAKGFAVEGSEQENGGTTFPSPSRGELGGAQQGARAMNKTDATRTSVGREQDYPDYEGANGGFDMSYWVGYAQERVRAATETVAVQVQEHPLRSMAIAGALGFVIGTTLRHRALPTILRSALGVAAAMAIRELAERGMSEMGSSEDVTLPHAQAEE